MITTLDSNLALNYVAGDWQAGEGEETVTDPSFGDQASAYSPATLPQLENSVAAAVHAFESGGWSNNPRRRAQTLAAMADKLVAAKSQIIAIAARESGKRAPELVAECDMAISELRYYAGLVRSISGRVQEVGEGELAVFTREPIGVAAIIVPWNAPIALLVRSLAPALAAGCTAVVKGAPQTSLTNATVIAALTDDVDIPKGAVNSLNESGNRIGRALVAHPGVNAISFTGSPTTAMHIAKSAADTFKRLNLELGGKSPAIVFGDVRDLDAAAEAIARGALIAAGQQCTAISRVLVEHTILPRFRELLAARLQSIKVGPANDPLTQMGPVISKASRDRLLALVASKSADAVVQGDIAPNAPGGGFYISPSLIAVQDVAEPIVQHEHFGPVITLEAFSNEAEAVWKANATVYGLAASIWSQDIACIQRVGRALKFGTVWINTHNKIIVEGEVGGFKQSGVGRLHGPGALDSFLEMKQTFHSAGFIPSVASA